MSNHTEGCKTMLEHLNTFLWNAVEQLLPTPEDRGSNPVIGKNDIECLQSTVLKRRKKEKRDRDWPS